jgi:hypothetical protein
MKLTRQLTIFLFLVSTKSLLAFQDESYVSFIDKKGYFPVVVSGTSVPIVSAPGDHTGVKRAIANFRLDVERVTGIKPEIRETHGTGRIILAGTLGMNPLIDQLVVSRKLDVSEIKGRWEAFIIKAVDKPFDGVDQALVIVGSDKRGTIFGLYDLSEKIGVSPWYWWADVPVKKQADIFIMPDARVSAGPAVKYRGIFINDEQPALGGWVAENYGGFNSRFYEKVFELILRMKGNFLWPAMWGQSFYSEDPLNPKLADEYGVVISTSHHEPLMRAHVEWKRNGGNAWNYQANPTQLREFWKEGIKRMGTYESVVTLAMRGDGDEPMSEDSNIKLLQRIVEDQRNIIAETTGKPVEATPQVWALYKEVQDYYDRGMRVPDDVTLLLCDDNWGNIRKLPKSGEKLHPGGYGIYYHFDYVGGPRNYKWLNTNPIPRIWEQMNLAYEYKANKIWVVNVGDIKPMEFPIQFFLDYAWGPDNIRYDKLEEYTKKWAAREFPSQFSEEIASLMSLYSKYNGRRKPELLAPDSFSPNLYSLTDYREAETIVQEYNDLARRGERLNEKLPEEYRAAFYQLILYPVTASANLNEFYYTVRLNRLYGSQGRAETNVMAQKAKYLFERDAELSKFYNKKMAAGKWNHMMDQLHIGYVGWHDDFKQNTMPELKTVTVDEKPSMGIVVEGSTSAWPDGTSELILSFDKTGQGRKYIEIFNRGTKPFDFTITTPPSIIAGIKKGTVTHSTRIFLEVDWKKLKTSTTDLPITIKASTGEETKVILRVSKHDVPTLKPGTFIEGDGYVSMEAAHFSRAVKIDSAEWRALPGHGRTVSAIKVFPVTSTFDIAAGPKAEYDIYFARTGKFKVYVYLSPSIDFTAGNGLEFGMSFDNGSPVTLNMHAGNSLRNWEESVKNNVNVVFAEIEVTTPGIHTLAFLAGDPGIVIQKIVVDTGGLKPSYLGPPESLVTK